MAQSYRTKGFIFKKEDRQEADRVFSIFTEDFGRVEISAKAIRKIASKLKGGIEIFSLSEIEFIQGKNKKTLTDAIFLERFNRIAQSPEKMETAYQVSDLIDHFVRGQVPDEKIWKVMVKFFQAFNGQSVLPNKPSFWYYYFFWNFVSAAGFMPELSRCVTCSQSLHPEHLYFSNKEGGVMCQSCAQSHRQAKNINADVVKMIRLFLKNEWDTVSKLKAQASSNALLKSISDTYSDYLMHTYSFQA
jgi:DNA repair protein RecO (recombination protein O)